MTTALVTLFDGNPVTTTLVLADGTENQHGSIIKLVRKYHDDLSEFGQVRFEIRLNTQGSPTEYAYLNEQQATLLMTYMSNTPIIRQFKKRLVAAFFELAAGKALQIRSTSDNVQTKVTVNTSELVREAHKGNRFAQRLLHHLTGMQVDDLAAELDQQQAGERFQQAELIATYLDTIVNGCTYESLGAHGLDIVDDDHGRKAIVATTTNLFGFFNVVAGKFGLPVLAKSVNDFGQMMGREATALEFFGYTRSLEKVSRGRRFFRYQQVGGEA
ncbi:MAG: Rha family transcriptional regulator [Geobacter sp.]